MGKTKLIPLMIYIDSDLKAKLKKKQDAGYSASFLIRKFLAEGLSKMKEG